VGYRDMIVPPAEQAQEMFGLPEAASNSATGRTLSR
jgi:hypothetical protein